MSVTYQGNVNFEEAPGRTFGRNEYGLDSRVLKMQGRAAISDLPALGAASVTFPFLTLIRIQAADGDDGTLLDATLEYRGRKDARTTVFGSIENAGAFSRTVSKYAGKSTSGTWGHELVQRSTVSDRGLRIRWASRGKPISITAPLADAKCIVEMKAQLLAQTLFDDDGALPVRVLGYSARQVGSWFECETIVTLS